MKKALEGISIINLHFLIDTVFTQLIIYAG